MKKIILITIICFISTNIFSQTYKLETVFSDKISETYLSHWKALDNDSKIDTFSLWGYQLYYDDWSRGCYEVEYFKGNAREMFNFLTKILEFTEKYKEEDKVVTHILGIQVKTIKQLGFKYTLVYEKEHKVTCMFNQKQWTDMLVKFESYCNNLNINFKE